MTNIKLQHINKLWYNFAIHFAVLRSLCPMSRDESPQLNRINSIIKLTINSPTVNLSKLLCEIWLFYSSKFTPGNQPYAGKNIKESNLSDCSIATATVTIRGGGMTRPPLRGKKIRQNSNDRSFYLGQTRISAVNNPLLSR